MKKPDLIEITATFHQDKDELQGNQFGQFLKINTADAGKGKYFVISTDRWAFDDPKELLETIQDFIKRTA
jgi:hypothetical protein